MIRMYINDEEVVSNKEFTITEEMLNTSSTILNNCFPKSWEITKDYVNNFYYPLDYSKCRIYNDDELIFCGVVKNTGDISLNPREPHYCSLQILDFKTLLSEGETLDFVISEKTIEEAINIVVEAVSGYGIVVGDINILNGDDIIGAYSTLDKTAYDVLQYLADISQSKWTTRTIDEYTIAVDFYDPTLMPIGTPIENTTEFYEENEIIDISFSYGTRDYRNKQVILSNEVYGSIDYNETIITTGYTRDFMTNSNIALIKSIKVNGIEKTFTTDDRKEIGEVADFYYTKGKNTFNSNSDSPIYSAGSTISIQYTPLVQGRQVVYNNIEVSRINNQLGRKGVIARYENRNDILNSDELQKVGQTYLKYKGTAEITLKVQTKDNDLYNIGQIVHYNSPLQELSVDYMVKKKERQIIAMGNDQYIFYTYELSSNYNSENAINYFDNQRNKANGNISQGEYISRNIDIENTANIIFYDLEISEIEITGDNILDSILESPLNN